jgi:hypothetical protein
VEGKSENLLRFCQILLQPFGTDKIGMLFNQARKHLFAHGTLQDLLKGCFSSKEDPRCKALFNLLSDPFFGTFHDIQQSQKSPKVIFVSLYKK